MRHFCFNFALQSECQLLICIMKQLVVNNQANVKQKIHKF